MRHWAALLRSRSEKGFVLPLTMLVLMVVGMMGATLVFAIQTNEHHVSRDRAYSQSLAVAEAGLNQYLWMVAAGKSSEYNDFAIFGNPGPDPHRQTIQLTDAGTDVKGTYTLFVTPPSADDGRITVTITGKADSPAEAPRTVRAHIGRPSFSEYLLLVDDTVNIGGPLDRVWWGKTHSNSGIRIDTANIIDMVTCARAKHKNDSSKGGGLVECCALQQSIPRVLELSGTADRLRHDRFGLRQVKRQSDGYPQPRLCQSRSRLPGGGSWLVHQAVAQ